MDSCEAAVEAGIFDAVVRSLSLEPGESGDGRISASAGRT